MVGLFCTGLAIKKLEQTWNLVSDIEWPTSQFHMQ